MACIISSRFLVSFLFLAVSMTSHFAVGRRTCFVSLRLKTTSGVIDKDIADFRVRSFLGCSRAKKDCPGKVLDHVKGIFGDVNPFTGDSTMEMCKLFGRELLPSDEGEVTVHTVVSNCNSKDSKEIGRLCCFKCKVGPYIFYHPINHCALINRPVWCPK